MSRKIKLTRDQLTIVDNENYSDLNKDNWFAQYDKCTKGFYAMRAAKGKDGKQIREIMHRRIMNAPKGMVVDHINGNTLDNRKQNLRICSVAENTRGKKLSSVNKSGYKGVMAYNYNKIPKWRVQIQKQGKNKHVGYFTDIIEAAKAYDAAAIKYYGKFARLNFPKKVE